MFLYLDPLQTLSIPRFGVLTIHPPSHPQKSVPPHAGESHSPVPLLQGQEGRAPSSGDKQDGEERAGLSTLGSSAGSGPRRSP